jgi:DNA-binding NarL/FixJ family response regulator
MGQRARSLDERRLADDLIGRLAELIPSTDQREAFMNAGAARLPPGPTQRQADKHAFSGLTEREREIAALVAAGNSNAAIAGELVISERTVETHVTNILAKLSFSSRSQIAAWAAERGIAKPSR